MNGILFYLIILKLIWIPVSILIAFNVSSKELAEISDNGQWITIRAKFLGTFLKLILSKSTIKNSLYVFKYYSIKSGIELSKLSPNKIFP